MKEMRYKSYKTYQNIIKWQCPINSYYKCKCIKVPRSRKAQIRRMDWGGEKKKQDPTICCQKEIHFTSQDTHTLKAKGWKRYSTQRVTRKNWSGYTNMRQNKSKKVTTDKRYFILIKGSIYQEYNYILRNKPHQGGKSLVC